MILEYIIGVGTVALDSDLIPISQFVEQSSLPLPKSLGGREHGSERGAFPSLYLFELGLISLC
jgi:hypothetical protein